MLHVASVIINKTPQFLRVAQWCNMPGKPRGTGLPIVAETYDGMLSVGLHDSMVQPIDESHVFSALDHASETAPVAEGNVGGGTGMNTAGFKAGIGSVCYLDRQFTAAAVWQPCHGSVFACL